MGRITKRIGVALALLLASAGEGRSEVSYAYAQTLTDLQVAAMNSGFTERQADVVIQFAVLIANNQLCDKRILKSNDDIAAFAIQASKSIDIPSQLFLKSGWESATKLGEFIRSDNSEWLRFCGTQK